MNSILEERFSLTGNVAIVTGAASGIGKEICNLFAGVGASVVAADIDEQAVTKVAADLDQCLAASRRDPG